MEEDHCRKIQVGGNGVGGGCLGDFSGHQIDMYRHDTTPMLESLAFALGTGQAGNYESVLFG